MRQPCSSSADGQTRSAGWSGSATRHSSDTSASLACVANSHAGLTAQLEGLVALRIADAHILPLNISRYGDEIIGYSAGVRKLAAGTSSAELTSSLDKLDAVAVELQTVAHRFESVRHSAKICAAGTRKLNAIAVKFERAFISEKGLPGREWVRRSRTSTELIVAVPSPHHRAWPLARLRRDAAARCRRGAHARSQRR